MLANIGHQEAEWLIVKFDSSWTYLFLLLYKLTLSLTQHFGWKYSWPKISNWYFKASEDVRKAEEKARKEEAEKRSYSTYMTDEKMTSNQGGGNDSDDFM